jgi:hypothetical protein
MKTPDRCRIGSPPGTESGPTGLYFGISCYRRPTIRASPTTFHTVSEGEFSEVPDSRGPMQQGFLCRVSEIRTLVYKTPIIPTDCILAPPRQGTPNRGEAVFFPRSLQKIPKILARNGCRNVQETLARYGSEVRSLAGAERMLKA